MKKKWRNNLRGVNKSDAISYEDALVKIGFGQVQVELVFAIMLVLINVFNETMGISNLIPAAECDLQLTSSSKGLLSSMVFFGIMVSGYIWGYLGDTQGRRWVILWCLLFSTIFTIISAFVNNFGLFLACRFFTGVFVGGYSGVMYAYISEFNFAKYRAAMISWSSIAIGLSMTFMPLMALCILKYDFNYELYPGYHFRPWRLVLLVYALPGVIAGLWVSTRLRESPRFLLSVKRDDEALEVVKWMQITNRRKNTEIFEIKKLKPEPNPFGSGKSYKGIKAIMMSLKDQTLPLIKPPYIIQFIVCCVLQFGTFSIAGGLNLFLPDILNNLSILEQQTQSNLQVCDISMMKASNETINTDLTCNSTVESGIYTEILILGFVHIIGYFVLALIVRPERRKAITAATFIISSVSGFVLPLLSNHYLIVACFCSFIMFAGLNVSLINAAACDIFPVNLRSMAVSLAMLVGRFGSISASNIVGNTLDNYCIHTYYGAAIIALFCFAISFIINN
ncbi:hypothetical protein PVAND_005847 [Polypedilum vanderplanki]|uniref:Major facilitator superfamily (MFS) profile domain-containing protein n=1 Tax=Polypedilum vanderplanki TaxID=319348 RepID=A0A9J6C1S7_POLVA|nr:hypothetical protein PVAND_005847 [Polypedilum vanderplanki]